MEHISLKKTGKYVINNIVQMTNRKIVAGVYINGISLKTVIGQEGEMARIIRRRVAQQIVETVRDVCNHNINFIDTKGVIFASTDAARVGDFHEIGRQVAVTGETIEVTDNDSYLGTHKGVNIPFVYQGELVAVIGISGDPDEVRKYAYLAQKITALILREQEMEDQSNSRRQQMNYMVRALTTGEHIHHDYFAEFLESYHTDRKAEYRTVLIQMDSRFNPANLSFVEKDIYQMFSQTQSPFYTFQYPNEYILFLAASEWKRCMPLIQRLAEQYKEILKIGVGNAVRLTRQNQSYGAAKIALQSHVPDRRVMVFDDLDLEILLGSVPAEARVQFLKKTLDPLDEKDRQLLNTYFDANFSLKETCERLYIHKNTVQYQLDRIWRKCGYNPRSFRDAVVLYMGLQLE